MFIVINSLCARIGHVLLNYLPGRLKQQIVIQESLLGAFEVDSVAVL